MSCKICGRQTAPGAKLCVDCRAARKRAFDATITQPLLAMAGAGPVSRTISRLRRSDRSPEAQARRAARKAAKAQAIPPPLPVAVQEKRRSRPLLWALLSIGVVLAGIAGWYLPSHTPQVSEDAPPSAAVPATPQGVPGVVEQAKGLPQPAQAPSTLPPLPSMAERELVPYSPAPAKAAPKRPVAVPKVVVPPVGAPAEVEVVRAPPAAPTPAPPPAAPRVDPWQQMAAAIARCPDGFLERVICEQRIRLQYCDGHWGQVAQCPGGPSADHN
jgi:hypothetical protein